MFKRNNKKRDVKINTALCSGCGVCTKKCRHNVLQLVCKEGEINAWYARPDQCTACGKCALICKSRAITFKERNKKQLTNSII